MLKYFLGLLLEKQPPLTPLENKIERKKKCLLILT